MAQHPFIYLIEMNFLVGCAVVFLYCIPTRLTGKSIRRRCTPTRRLSDDAPTLAHKLYISISSYFRILHICCMIRASSCGVPLSAVDILLPMCV